MSRKSTEQENRRLLDDFVPAMSGSPPGLDDSSDSMRMRRLPTEGPQTPSHLLTTSPETLAFLPAETRPPAADRSTSQRTANDSSSSKDVDVEGGAATNSQYPPQRPPIRNRWWNSLSTSFEKTLREGSKIAGVISIPLPFTKRVLRVKLFSWWLSLNGIIVVGILVLWTILGLFAWNSTRSDHNNIFVLPSTDSIFVVTTLSTAGTTLLGMLVGSALEAVRWRKAVHGVHATTFLGIASATGPQGKFALLTSKRVHWSTKIWVLVVFAFAGVNYLLSNILTVGLASATIFHVNYWDFTTMAGIGPWVPYDFTGILYPNIITNMSEQIAFSYDSFTGNPSQVFQLTTNLTQFPGSHTVPTTFRTLCDDGCFAYLLPGTISQVVTSGPQPPLGTAYCNGANPSECVTPPFVFDVAGLQTLYACDPSDTLCIANAVLNDRKSPNRSTFSTLNTNISSWPLFNVSDTLRTHGPAAMLYFEPFTFGGLAQSSNMTACEVMVDDFTYAINLCYKEIDGSSFAIGWSVCEPIFQGCDYRTTDWRETLTASTIMSMEQRYVGAIHSLSTGVISGIEDFEASQGLTVNSTQFFNVVAAVFNESIALRSLVYNTVTSPDLAHFGADVRMRDLLTCTYALGASQIQVDAPIGANIEWNNAGQAGINTATDRIILSLQSIIIFVVFAALTLIVCALMLAYASTGITPNTTDFSELDIASRVNNLHIFDGLSNADNKEVVEKIANDYIWVGESEDGRGVEMSSERLAPLQLGKRYV